MAEAEPVIIDDGGSTRIKQLVDNEDMDNLLGKIVGGQTVYTDLADGTFTDNGGGFKCSLKVRFHDKQGVHNIRPNPPAQPAGLNLLPNDSVQITSQNGQIVTLAFDPTFRLVITLTASVAGIAPIVEAKQNGAQRRYIVANAGAIQKVDHTRAGAVTNLYDATADPSIYTMIHLRAKDRAAP